MPLRNFMFDLEDVLRLSKMRSRGREYRRAFAALKKRCVADDASVQVPGRRRWARMELVSVLIALALCIGMIALFINRGRIPKTMLKWACIAWLVGLYLALIPALWAHWKQRRMTDAYLDGRIQLLGDRLQKLSPEQLAHAEALLHGSPHYFFDEYDAPFQPGDAVGCFHCGGIFPAENFDWQNIPEEFRCPQCGQRANLVYGDAEVPVTEEILQILHDLFDEEN